MNQETKTTDAYNKIAAEYSERNYNLIWVNEYNYYKTLLSGNKIIDLGCGAGRDGEHFVKDGYDYLGIDSSSEMIKIAKNRVKNGEFKIMDLRNMTLPLESFDGFWASASLLHFPKTEAFSILKSFFKLLKRDGVGFVSVKEKTKMDEGFIKEDKGGGIERYFSFYMEGEMINLLETAGFEILNITHLLEDDKFQTKWLCFFVKK
ncbi:MAG: class I SAM-dependent methyltransferase [Candidatus Falkowbacteria bacterium]